MAGLPRSILLDTAMETDPRGRWVRLDLETRDDPDLIQMVEEFVPLDHPAGAEAGRWLREDALDNDGLTKTRLLVSDERIEGFIATCFGSVELSNGGIRRLTVPRHLQRRAVPALLVCWVARHQDSEIPGLQLMLTAVGLARKAKRIGGLVALALDPHDNEVAEMWKGEPWHFQTCRKADKNDRPTRLFIPV